MKKKNESWWKYLVDFFDQNAYEKEVEEYLKKFKEPPDIEIDKQDKELEAKIEFIYKISEAAFEATLLPLEKQNQKIILILVYIFSFISYTSFKSLDLILNHRISIVFSTYLFLVISGYILLAIFIILYGWRPKRTGKSGNEPRSFLQAGVLTFPLVSLKIRELDHIQYKICCNQAWVNRLVKYINATLYGLILTPIIIAPLLTSIIFCLSHFWFPYHH